MSDTSIEKRTLTPEDYLKDRVAYKVGAYTKKGERYRWGYIIMACTATVGAAGVPVLINLNGVPQIVPTLASLLVTILVGLESLLHLREHWRNYDMMKSYLRQETNLFKAGAGPYRELSSPEVAFAVFVERVEAEIAKERSQTIEMRTAREVDNGPRTVDPGKDPKRDRGTEGA